VVLLGALGILGLLLAIILFATGSLVAGLILLGLAVGALALWIGGIRQDPEAPGAKPALRALNRTGSLMALAAVGTRAWSHAGLELIKIRQRRMHLRRQLKAGLRPLGEAVYRGDEARAEVLRSRATDIERELGELEARASSVTAAARAQLAREHASVEPTRSLTVPEMDGSGANT
jgi:hypothetical protein